MRGDVATATTSGDALVALSDTVHIYDDADPTVALCGVPVTQLVDDDPADECVVCLDLEACEAC